MKRIRTKLLQKVQCPVFIGSKNRFDFPMASLVVGTFLMVEPQDYEEYSKRYNGIYEIIKLQKNNGGFAFLMNSILEEAKKRGFKYFMFCDDDLLGFFQMTDSENLYNFSFDEVYEKGIEIMKANGYSQLSFGFKGHNFYKRNKDNKKVHKRKEIVSNTGAWGMFLANTDDLLAVGGYEEELAIFNDWEISARLLKNNYKTATWYRYMFDHKMKSMKGGASEIYAKKEKIAKAIEFLIERYGTDVIKKVEKHNQTEARFNFRKIAKNPIKDKQ